MIASLAGGALIGRAPEKTKKALLDYLERYRRAAPIELSTNFELTATDLEGMLAELESARKIRRTPAGNGEFIEALSASGSCDVDTGVCTTY